MLLALDDAPWGDVDAKPCNSRRLRKLLGQYVTRAHKPIKPRGHRTPPASPMATTSEDLTDAWSRYCPPLSGWPPPDA